MTSLPESIKVGPFVYSVARQPMEDFGQNDPRRHKITIADDLAAACERETLVHEVLHCVFQATGRVFPGGGTDPDDDAEQLIRLWSAGILGVLRDNPDLVAYLVAP